jgi:hypothetical protein
VVDNRFEGCAVAVERVGSHAAAVEPLGQKGAQGHLVAPDQRARGRLGHNTGDSQGFDRADRGQLITACGTGKTLTALFISEKLAADRTLVLVPSLSLLAQTLRD